MSEPDKLAGGVGFGPRVIISQQALRETGLLQPGSLTRWLYRLIVEAEASGKEASDSRIDALVEEAETLFPDASWQIRTRANASPQLARNLERFSLFLTLVGLAALLVGGVGVANAVKSHIDRRRDVIASFKALGATGRDVFTIYLTQVILLAVVVPQFEPIFAQSGKALPFVTEVVLGAGAVMRAWWWALVLGAVAVVYLVAKRLETPEAKLRLIREEQAKGKLVAMCGDGTNDAPALAQADVGVAMQTGTNAAREAGNMVDLDSDPTKLIEIVAIGKQLLMTRGALTTFSIANDVAKYFAIIPAMFIAFYPQLGVLNVMGLATPQSAILSAIIFNALIIVALIPLALRGVQYRPSGAAALLRRNLLIYGIGGLVVPFVGIKLIDVVVSATGLA